jgi:multidrug efflux pump subunit AcrA (membrane-fusion protein)
MFEMKLPSEVSLSLFTRQKPPKSLLVILTAALGFCAACEQAKPPAAIPEVEVVEVSQQDVPITRTWVATMTGMVNAQIRAQVPGYLMHQTYTNGSYVRKGAPLFQLDARTFQAALDQAKGVLEQAKGDLTRAQAQQGKTQLDVNRYTPLAQTGAISKQELDDAVQNNLSALAQVETGRASVASAVAFAMSQSVSPARMRAHAVLNLALQSSRSVPCPLSWLSDGWPYTLQPHDH